MIDDSNLSMRYWHYYCDIESDLKNISRYIDFSTENHKTHSIELTHILLSACSEIDVLLKEICLQINSKSKANDIHKYKKVVISELEELITEEVRVGLHGLSIKPWESWVENINPEWWTIHNKVKHERNTYYKEANLKNTIDAVCGLYICINYFYRVFLTKALNKELRFHDITRILKSESKFIQFTNVNYYDSYLIL